MISSYMIQPASAIRPTLRAMPDSAGVYAMLLDRPEALEAALDRAHLKLDPLRLGHRAVLYLGATDGSLQRRLKCHLSSDTSRSTFRMSLGAVLAEELGLIVKPVGYRNLFAFTTESEQALNDWIDANVSIAMRASANALLEEKSLIASHSPVLNIAGRRDRAGAEAVMLVRSRFRSMPYDHESLN